MVNRILYKDSPLLLFSSYSGKQTLSLVLYIALNLKITKINLLTIKENYFYQSNSLELTIEPAMFN